MNRRRKLSVREEETGERTTPEVIGCERTKRIERPSSKIQRSRREDGYFQLQGGSVTLDKKRKMDERTLLG